jgi:hypothetical protein
MRRQHSTAGLTDVARGAGARSGMVGSPLLSNAVFSAHRHPRLQRIAVGMRKGAETLQRVMP